MSGTPEARKPQQGEKPPVVFVLGPTGTGKSALGLAIAREFGGEIVNCDSRQVYRDFPLITAQPGPEEVAQCPHHLYGFLPTQASIDAGQFAQLAAEKISWLRGRGKLPVLVGGTGLYVRALLYGLAPIPQVPEAVQARIMAQCRKSGPELLHQRLQEIDPSAAARVHPRDKQRITRALEVFEATGKPLSWWMRAYPCQEPKYTALCLGLWSDLKVLEPRLQARIENMCAQGALQEARQALAACGQESAPGWSGIGCHELLQVILDRWSLPHAQRIWLKNTRAYAKRQLTWFKKESDIVWHTCVDVNRILERVGTWYKDCVQNTRA